MHVYEVEAFCGPGARGNPAGVAVLDGMMPEDRMQRQAALLNFSETAYVTLARGVWGLRWFTPSCEVDLCGHATLAAAHILWSEGLAVEEKLHFETRSGLLTAQRAGQWTDLDFPSSPASPMALDLQLIQVLGLEDAAQTLKAKDDALLVLPSEKNVRQLRPDFSGMAKLPYRAVMVTAPASQGSGFDFVSRFFAPRLGIPEDSVTGSAHCVLGPFWAGILGKTELAAFQVSSRGGILRLKVSGVRVVLSGMARTVRTRVLEQS